jgi:cytoskeletal protein CcmA (bactofilin family)
MWKKEDAKPQASESPAAANTAFGTAQSPDAPGSNSLPVSPRAAACISRGIKIRGEVTGTEDLFVDGQVEGKLNLTANSCLTIGPNGEVKADLNAREIIVRGKVEGKITARDKLQIWSTGQITGEVQTDRLAIEDGALLRGKVEAGKQIIKPAETKAAAATATSKAAPQTTGVNSGTAAD